MHDCPLLGFSYLHTDHSRKDRKTHMGKASEVNRIFFGLIVPKTFRLSHNLTQIHVDYSNSFWKTNNHTSINYNISYSSLVKCFSSHKKKHTKQQMWVRCICRLNVKLLTTSKEDAENKLQTSKSEWQKSSFRHLVVK